ncbi:MAG: hypothetical protein PHY99_00135 [Bacteroidales bacterium]|nr:hypothetical protein [Bacteroidales bacterium]
MTDQRRNLIGCISILFIFICLSIKLPAQDVMPDSLVKERIQCIQTMLQQDKINTDRWWYGWLGGYSAATVGQGAVSMMSDDKSTQQDMALGAATTALGAVGQLIAPLHPGRQAELLINLPESTCGERLAKLAVAEEYLKKSAETEKLGKSWKAHALYGAVNLSSGLITWLGFNRSIWAGVGNLAMNTVISEVQIWTQPTRSMKNYEAYCRKYNPGIMTAGYKPRPEVYLCAAPGGVGMKIVF